MTKNIIFHYPSRVVGGAEFLFYRVAMYLSVNNFANIKYVDYKDGFVASRIKDTDIELINAEDNIKISSDSCIITVPTLLFELKNINPHTKILCWNLHPSSFQWLKNKLNCSDKQIKYVLNNLISKDALYNMDFECFNAVKQITDTSQKNFIPVSTDIDENFNDFKDLIDHKSINIAWLGRLDDDKIFSLINVLDNLCKYISTKTINFYIIGDGVAKNKINLLKYKQKDIIITFKGILKDQDLQTFLLNNVDLLFAMGTSMLEAGKLGIPAVLTPLSFENFHTNNYIWLDKLKDHTLGIQKHNMKQYIDITSSLEEVLEEIYIKNNKIEIGKSCYNHCNKNFSIEHSSEILLDSINNTKLDVSDIRDINNNLKRKIKMNIGQKIINLFRYAIVGKDYLIFLKKIRNLKNEKNRKVVLFASMYSRLTNMKQRPEHLLKLFSNDGHIVIWPDINISKVVEIENNIFLVPYKFLKKLLKEKHLSKIIISISTHYTLPKVSDYLNCAVKNNDIVLYEHLDDFTLFSNQEQELRNEFKKICKNDKIIISATADNLFQEAVKYRGNKKNIILVKNGVNLSDFKMKKIESPPKQIQDVVNKNKPIIGYYGCIVDEWFDYELINDVAKQNKDIEFILIGYKNGKFCQSLFKNENITYIPKIEYEEIPYYATFFDIATIPFQINEITKSTSPVKLFEYMALGLPIITTPIQECLNYKSCLIANNAEEYTQLIHKALELKNDEKYLAILEHEASENTWEQRYKILQETLLK